MQAVALPEAKEVTEDPGKLPEPDKVTKAYFEVSFSSFQSQTSVIIQDCHPNTGNLISESLGIVKMRFYIEEMF